MAKDTNQLVPVQRQVTRGGRTFMTTVYVKPRHAKTSKDTKITVPDWQFKTAQGFQDEFDRINKMRDKTARQYLKEQLLDHVEQEMGVKYDKLPASSDRAFVRNSLRGFSAAKKHLAEGKGYAVKKEEKKPTKKKNKVKDSTRKKERKRRSLPTKMLEAYDAGTPRQKAIALLTGIMPEDDQAADWLAQQVAYGRMDIISTRSTQVKTPLEGTKVFESSADYLVTMMHRAENALEGRTNVDFSLGYVEHAMRRAKRFMEHKDDTDFSKKNLKAQIKSELASQQWAPQSNATKITPELDKLLEDSVDSYIDIIQLASDMSNVDTSNSRDDAPGDFEDYVKRGTRKLPNLNHVPLRMDRSINVNNYIADLTKRAGKSPAQVSYADLTARQEELIDTLNSGKTDEIWEKLDFDKVLEGENVAGPRGTRVQTGIGAENTFVVGGENELMLNSWLLSQSQGYWDTARDKFYSDVAWENMRVFKQGMVEAGKANQDILKKIDPNINFNLGGDHVPKMTAIKESYEAGDITREEVIKLLKPAFNNLHEVSKISPGIFGGPDDPAVWGERYPLVDLETNPTLDLQGGTYMNRLDRVLAGEGDLSYDPFMDIRQRAGVNNTTGEDNRNYKFSEMTAEDVRKVADTQNGKATDVKRRAQAKMTDKVENRNAMKLNIFCNQVTAGGGSHGATSSQYAKYSKIASQDIEFPDDEFLDNPRISGEDKIRYGLKLATTLEDKRDKVKAEMLNYIAHKNDLGGTPTPPKLTKTQKINKAREELYDRIIGSTPSINGTPQRIQNFSASALENVEMLDATDLAKSTIKTSIGTVSRSKMTEMAEKVRDTHDMREHASFKPRIRNVYEIKSSINDEKYEEHKAKIGGETREFYHGTSFQTTQKILGETGGFKVFEQGSRIKTGSMMGFGIYLADKSSKSGQYISSSGYGRTADRGSLLVCEATLGKKVPFDRWNHMGQSHKGRPYDTVEALAGVGGRLRNPEWLVKDALQAKPKYIIDYERTTR